MTNSSWVVVLFRQPNTGESEPHLFHHPQTPDEDPFLCPLPEYCMRLGEVRLMIDEPVQVTEVVWAKEAR